MSLFGFNDALTNVILEIREISYTEVTFVLFLIFTRASNTMIKLVYSIQPSFNVLFLAFIDDNSLIFRQCSNDMLIFNCCNLISLFE